jgi:hypothetical protein
MLTFRVDNSCFLGTSLCILRRLTANIVSTQLMPAAHLKLTQPWPIQLSQIFINVPSRGHPPIVENPWFRCLGKENQLYSKYSKENVGYYFTLMILGAKWNLFFLGTREIWSRTVLPPMPSLYLLSNLLNLCFFS